MALIQCCTKWLLASPITGNRALVISLAAVLVPTLVRISVDGMVSGIAFSPYLPSVLICALLLGWRHALAVTIASVVVADLMFIDPRYIFIAGPTDVFGMIIFLLSSALMICVIQSSRALVHERGRPAGASDEIIFSLERGQAWASWPGASYYVRLGRQEDVSAGMKDFLAQVEVGKRLNKDAG